MIKQVVQRLESSRNKETKGQNALTWKDTSQWVLRAGVLIALCASLFHPLSALWTLLLLATASFRLAIEHDKQHNTTPTRWKHWAFWGSALATGCATVGLCIQLANHTKPGATTSTKPQPIHIAIAKSGQPVVQAIVQYRHKTGRLPPSLRALPLPTQTKKTIEQRWGYTTVNNRQFLLSTNHPGYKDRVFYQLRPIPGWFFDYDDGNIHPIPPETLRTPAKHSLTTRQ